MRHITGFVCFVALAAAGCSDDGVVPQADSSGSSGSATTGPPANTDGAQTGGTSANDATGGSTSSSPTTGASDGGSTTGPATTGGSSSGGESSSSGGESSSSGGESSSSGGEESSSGGCVPLADGAAIGQDCGPGGAMCPPEYTCQPFVGFAFQETCQIICTMDCECPMGMTCNFTVDKTGVGWFQCGP